MGFTVGKHMSEFFSHAKLVLGLFWDSYSLTGHENFSSLRKRTSLHEDFKNHPTFIAFFRVVSLNTQSVYRVFHNDGLEVFAYCSKNMNTSDLLSLLGAHQMWSI